MVLGCFWVLFCVQKGFPAAFQEHVEKRTPKKADHLCQNQDFGVILGSPGATKYQKKHPKRCSKIIVFSDALPNPIPERFGHENERKNIEKQWKCRWENKRSAVEKVCIFPRPRQEETAQKVFVSSGAAMQKIIGELIQAKQIKMLLQKNELILFSDQALDLTDDVTSMLDVAASENDAKTD